MPKAYIFQEDSKAGSVLHVILILYLCCSMLDCIFLSKQRKATPKYLSESFSDCIRPRTETGRNLGPGKINGGCASYYSEVRIYLDFQILANKNMLFSIESEH